MMKNKLLPVRLGQQFSPPTHRAALTQMERGGNSVTLTEVSSVIMKCRLNYRGLAAQLLGLFRPAV